MKLLNIFFSILFLAITFQISFSQDLDVNGNWFKEIKGVDDFLTSYDFKKYTKTDVINAKERFLLITRFLPDNEWEGIYTSNTEIGNNELHWNAEDGFVYYSVYHTLGSLDYGKTQNKSDSVKLISEKSSVIGRKSLFSNNLIKVKIRERHYLVPENRLKDFAERAVGLNTNLSDFIGYYWFKLNESGLEISGLPVFPPKYKNYLRFSINIKITHIGNRQIYQEKLDDGTINREEIHRFVTLSAGKNKNIKKGMNFFVEDLCEWVEITKVFPKTSTGKIVRLLDENSENCFDSAGGGGQIIPCKEIKTGMKVKTKAHYF